MIGNVGFYSLLYSILVLEKGKIIEFDSPKQLLKDTTSQFYSLAKEAGVA
jgi:ATP-binding cassette subfamily C (CFTR/MRP) protein 1